jgi:hypothetical protein
MILSYRNKATGKIRYLKHAQIDKKKWDDCVAQSNNFKIFAFSWWLDIVSPDWHALVLDDYKAVMPLTWKKKYGLPYLIQPIFCQQLGIFSENIQNYQKLFFKSIPKKFLFVRICITDTLKEMHKKGEKIHANYLLHLKDNYENLKNNFSKSTKKSIKKAVNRKVSISFCPQEECIAFLKNEYFDLLNIEKEKFDVLDQILSIGSSHGKLKCFGAYENNTMLATACCLLANKHIFMNMVASPEGKEKRALFLLIDEMIKFYSSQDVVLDFGGSDVESIAYVFSGFGARKMPYTEINFSPLFY